MANNNQSVHGIWRNRWIFILAATGSAVGLGNIWKFPYITGEHGGGAFVLMYLACIALVGIPVMVAEVAMGRRGRQSPINTMISLISEAKAGPAWKAIGWMGALAGFLILSFYSVIAGWALSYVLKLAAGTFVGADQALAGDQFSDMLGDPSGLMMWHTIFMVLTAGVIMRGVNKGIESAIQVLMPLLFVLLLVLIGYAAKNGNFAEAVHFMFDADFSKLSAESVLVALGHAFFTLSLGMGAIMAYGAYMPRQASIGTTVFAIAGLDTLVALLAGLAIFPIVFANGLEPSAGPGLLFVSLPLAFGNMAGGQFFGALFFILVTFAAWSSAISLIEPATAWAVERFKTSRVKATIGIAFIIWFLGIGTVFSFNDWSDYVFFAKTPDGIELFAVMSELKAMYPTAVDTLKGLTFFDLLDFITANIMLPLGGLLIALFVGFGMKYHHVYNEMQVKTPLFFNIWYVVLRFITPIAIGIVFIQGLLPECSFDSELLDADSGVCSNAPYLQPRLIGGVIIAIVYVGIIVKSLKKPARGLAE
ncbi:sodium-dependent transporter [Litoribacillus peritrichatus]|uniref:Transporter n=1 Tax=Litoribacillus peritrichatus TaxID=718191 RepID=A0ABP7MXY5_9GAMM